MRIAFRYDGTLPVKGYGGTERILYWHMKELVRRGHHVTLIGDGAFDLNGSGIRLAPYDRKKDDWRTHIPKDTDVVHLQVNSAEEISFPTIFTLHGNGQPGEVFSENTVFLCRRHAELHGGNVFIFNALDLDEYPFASPSKNSDWSTFVFLAKASWRVKNLRDCTKACRRTRKVLHVAGGRTFWPSRWIKNHGMVDTPSKLQLLRQSAALLFPVRWPEPFGIAILEAMSQGVPVVGSEYGSLPEVVSAETGVLCRDYTGFENVVRATPRPFNPAAIRNEVETRFAIGRYTEEYLQAYERVVSGEELHAQKPRTVSNRAPQELLPF